MWNASWKEGVLAADRDMQREKQKNRREYVSNISTIAEFANEESIPDNVLRYIKSRTKKEVKAAKDREFEEIRDSPLTKAERDRRLADLNNKYRQEYDIRLETNKQRYLSEVARSRGNNNIPRNNNTEEDSFSTPYRENERSREAREERARQRAIERENARQAKLYEKQLQQNNPKTSTSLMKAIPITDKQGNVVKVKYVPNTSVRQIEQQNLKTTAQKERQRILTDTKQPIVNTEYGKLYVEKRNNALGQSYTQEYKDQVKKTIEQYLSGAINEKQLFDTLSGNTVGSTTSQNNKTTIRNNLKNTNIPRLKNEIEYLSEATRNPSLRQGKTLKQIVKELKSKKAELQNKQEQLKQLEEEIKKDTEQYGVKEEGMQYVPRNIDKRIGRLARTEVVAAYNLGKLAKLNEQGYSYFRWVASLEGTGEDSPCVLCKDRHNKIFSIKEILTTGDYKIPSRKEKDGYKQVFIPAHPGCYCYWQPIKGEDMDATVKQDIDTRVSRGDLIKAGVFVTAGAISLALLYYGLLKTQGNLKINRQVVRKIEQGIEAIEKKAKEEVVKEILDVVEKTAEEDNKPAYSISYKTDLDGSLRKERIVLQRTVKPLEEEIGIYNERQLEMVRKLQEDITTKVENNNTKEARSTFEPDENVVRLTRNLTTAARNEVKKVSPLVNPNVVNTIRAYQNKALEIVSRLESGEVTAELRMEAQIMLQNLNKYRYINAYNDRALEHVQENLVLVRQELISALAGQYIKEATDQPLNLSTAAILKNTEPYRDISLALEQTDVVRATYNNNKNTIDLEVDKLKNRLLTNDYIQVDYYKTQEKILDQFSKYRQTKLPTIDSAIGKALTPAKQTEYYTQRVLPYIENIINSNVPIRADEYNDYIKQLYSINKYITGLDTFPIDAKYVIDNIEDSVPNFLERISNKNHPEYISRASKTRTNWEKAQDYLQFEKDTVDFELFHFQLAHDSTTNPATSIATDNKKKSFNFLD